MNHSTTQSKIFFKILKVLLAVLFWVGVWELFYLLVNRDIIVASPLATALRICELGRTGRFWITCGSSLLNVLAGYAAGIVFGTLTAFITFRVRVADVMFAPLIYVIRATPVASFILLAYFWMSNSSIPAFISFLMVIPIIWGNLREGFARTDTELLEMAKVYRFSPAKRLVRIEIPSVSPYFLSGCKTALGLAWKAGIAAEALVRTSGRIGNMLNTAKNYLETVDIFAWTVVVIILSVVLEKVFVILFDSLTRRRPAR